MYFLNDASYLEEHDSFPFPPACHATSGGIVAVGGNLSPGMLLSAYRQGIFPWYSEGEPILWWSPDPRCVLFPSQLHIASSMKKFLRKKRLRTTIDAAFVDVITACKRAPRPHQRGTWITDEMLDAYVRLHHLGYAHSVEVWEGEMLAGGLYGVSLGRCFFAESMFRMVSNASKTALIRLAGLCSELAYGFIDCQVSSPHLIDYGALEIPRGEFLNLLNRCLKWETLRGSWGRFVE